MKLEQDESIKETQSYNWSAIHPSLHEKIVQLNKAKIVLQTNEEVYNYESVY